MDMSPVMCGPSPFLYFAVAAAVYLFPVGALVLRPLHRRSSGRLRLLTGTITLLGAIASPVALLVTISAIGGIILG